MELSLSVMFNNDATPSEIAWGFETAMRDALQYLRDRDTRLKVDEQVTLDIDSSHATSATIFRIA